MANEATAQVQLPPGYEDATPTSGPLAVSLPPGYEDAKPTGGPLATPSISETVRQAYKPGYWGPEQAAPVEPPRDHREEIVKSIAGDAGLRTYRAARDTVGKVETLLKSPMEAYDTAKQMVQEIGQNVVAGVMPGSHELGPSNPSIGQPIFPMPGVGAATKAFGAEAPVAAPAASPLSNNPFRAILKGKEVAQAPAEAAVREGVTAATPSGAPASGPILAGSKTILDDPLSQLAVKEKAAYRAIDQAAGFDLKEAKLGLKNDQYKLAQLGNTPADIATRKTLQASIDDSTARISDAEAKLAKANIDPKAADTLHTARMAGMDFKNLLVRSTAPDGTINVDKLLNSSKVLRFSKRGDRLAQFMGKDAADNYMTQLEAAQKAGVHAMKVQQVAKWIGGLVAKGIGISAAAGAGYEAVKLLGE
jgi:hypothetical protein